MDEEKKEIVEFDLDKADAEFRKELMKEKKIGACFMCKTCTASCPITMVDKHFNPLRIIRMALYGLKEEVPKSEFIWLCSSCYTCQESCPQGVRITDFMTLLKNMAVKEGYIPPGVRAQMDIIKGSGRIYPLDDFDNKKREKAGLPRLPTTCEAIKQLFG